MAKKSVPAPKTPSAKAEPDAPSSASANGELIDMEEAIERLKTTRPTFYRWLREGKLKGMKVGRQWRFYKRDIESFLKGEEPRIDESMDMTPFMEQVVRFEEIQTGKKSGSDFGTNVVAALNRMLLLAIASRASDIHLTPLIGRKSSEAAGVCSLRIDGAMHTVAEIEVRLLKPIIERIKIMSNMDLHERWAPQSNRIEIQVSGKTFDLRVATLATANGEAVTIRILPQESMRFDLEQMNYSQSVQERIERYLRRPWGMMIVTGPSGSGKTTVLYACLSRMAGPERKIISLESPVEVSLPWVTQIAVVAERGLYYPAMVRAALRSDPDVLMISQIREAETLELAFEAALLGHKVLTALHTEEAASALRRMLDMGSNAYVASEATSLIVGQRLVRRLCSKCSVSGKPSDQEVSQAEIVARTGGLGWDNLNKAFRVPKGCSYCGGVGYRGRMLIAEALEVTPEIATALRRNANVDELRTLAIGQGLTTLTADGVRQAAEGLTTLDEVLRHAISPA
ncbi:MAG: Flp pilus assembly complex ATPase component TadA [Planctomycetes bacterium]|nr:Flp pilus assembly complex ATPase component TadA [Planctomycetota bacterium]